MQLPSHPISRSKSLVKAENWEESLHLIIITRILHDSDTHQCRLNRWRVSKVLTLKSLLVAIHANKTSVMHFYIQTSFNQISLWWRTKMNYLNLNYFSWWNVPFSILPSWIPFYTTSESYRYSCAISLDLTMIVQLLGRSTFVHATVSDTQRI